MNVVLTIADLQPEGGGPSRSVRSLAIALADHGVRVQVAALHYGISRSAPVTLKHPRVLVHFIPCTEWEAGRYGAGGKFRRAVVKLCEPVAGTVLHDNGIWLGTNRASVSAARQSGVPLIVSPRGMLTSWSLRNRRLKKKLAWWLYQRRDLRSARVLHATSRDEADGFRALGMRQPIAVIPNGVEPPPSSLLRLGRGEGGRVPDNVSGRSQLSASSVSDLKGVPSSISNLPSSDCRTILFLSRIHRVKGLLDLVEAWGQIRPEGWRMVIAGGDADNHRVEVEGAIRARQLEASIVFAGELPDTAKWELYRAADLFVLPTKSENFGIAIAEALAAGVPVITTKGAPWADLTTHRCGWWIDFGVPALVEALREAIMLTGEQRFQMGQRGQRLVAEKYVWSRIAGQMLEVYTWILRGGPPPPCVMLLEDE